MLDRTDLNHRRRRARLFPNAGLKLGVLHKRCCEIPKICAHERKNWIELVGWSLLVREEINVRKIIENELRSRDRIMCLLFVVVFGSLSMFSYFFSHFSTLVRSYAYVHIMTYLVYIQR